MNDKTFIGIMVATGVGTFLLLLAPSYPGLGEYPVSFSESTEVLIGEEFSIPSIELEREAFQEYVSTHQGQHKTVIEHDGSVHHVFVGTDGAIVYTTERITLPSKISLFFNEIERIEMGEQKEVLVTIGVGWDRIFAAILISVCCSVIFGRLAITIEERKAKRYV